MIRKATIQDVKAIHALIGYYAKKGAMLARPLSELYENVRDFFACEEGGKLVGCAALRITWEDLAEVKSVAVSPYYKKRGIGTKLVEACIEDARSLGIKRVFVLTYEKGFFAHRGFQEVPKETMPHKIWMECVRCPHFPNCGEIPMAMDLGTPAAPVTEADAPAEQAGANHNAAGNGNQ